MKNIKKYVIDINELYAKEELGTYLEGLKDALNMTKAELKMSIKLLMERNDYDV